MCELSNRHTDSAIATLSKSLLPTLLSQTWTHCFTLASPEGLIYVDNNIIHINNSYNTQRWLETKPTFRGI